MTEALKLKGCGIFALNCPKFLFCGLVLMAAIVTSRAAPLISTDSPVCFFTSVADRLLRANTARWATSNNAANNGTLVHVLNPNFVATFNVTNAFGVTSIPVLVSNQLVYTPAVNRLLQLAANIYDATTTNVYPDIFRPLFSRNQNGFGTNIFITGYIDVTNFNGTSDPQFSLPIDISDLAGTNIQVVNLPVNIYGVPWIVGAKKGFPNFNELAMDCAFQITRKLEVTRPSTNALPNTYSYYQMFILNLTNQVGVECWNSYTNAYTNSVMIYVSDNLKNVVLTNDEGFSTNLSVSLANAYPVATWPGYSAYQPSLSFQLPLARAIMMITNSIYRFNQGGIPYLTPDISETYETNVIGYPQPRWGLMITNELRVVMVDTTVVPNRIIDYVELSGPNSVRDLTGEITNYYDTGTYGDDLWDINASRQGIPQGLANQVSVSLGLYPPGAATGVWNQTDPTLRENEIDGFRAFFHLVPLYPGNPGESQTIARAQTTNALRAPFTPIATVVQHISWQANDPLVHYLANDLNWPNAVRSDRFVSSLTDASAGDNLGMLNLRYAPWGKFMVSGFDQVDLNPYNLGYKDPLIYSSDGWDFPMGAKSSSDWLGRVHRGTPWQTVYLKSTNILAWTQGIASGQLTWRDWTGNYNAFDAANAAPVQDWHLASLLASLLNTNNPGSLVSVNNPDPAAWQSRLDGLTVLTNTLANQYGVVTIASNSPQAAFIAGAIESARTNQPGQAFADIGDILTVPQLSSQSPFLNLNNAAQQATGISDEAYELIPSQLLPLLRVDSVGLAASVNGQIVIQFSGSDGHAYAIQVSPDLVNWAVISTNFPAGGEFNFTPLQPPSPKVQFYRSILLK